jgi:hypothetical protein
MSVSTFVDSFDIASVAEMTVEASYISEIARKLQATDEIYAEQSFESVVSLVARSVQALENDGRVRTERPDYSEFGGQAASSPIQSIQNDEVLPDDEWERYTIVENPTTSMENVRSDYRDVVDPSIGLRDKISIADTISRTGNLVSRNAEAILYDEVEHEADEEDTVVRSDYESPDVDVIYRGDSRAIIFEITVRWENPISTDYVNAKLNNLMDKESTFGVPTDLVIFAPVFTDTIRERYSGDNIVTLARLPFSGEGFPVITPDDAQRRQLAEGSDLVGDNYPIVTDSRDRFLDGLDRTLRKYNPVGESQYRAQISNVVSENM